MSVGTFVQPDFEAQSGTEYKTNIDNCISVLSPAAFFAPCSQTTPDMSIKIGSGRLLVSGEIIEVSEQSTATFSIPTTYDRYDRVVISSISGSASIIQGVESASPEAPDITFDTVPICKILLSPSTTEVTNSDITDERVISLTSFGYTPGTYSKLYVSCGAATTVSIIANSIILSDNTNTTLCCNSVNVTVACSATGVNGLDSGSLVNDTWYHFYIIAKPDGTVSGLASTSSTNPTMPSGYTFKMLVSTLRYATATFRYCNQYDNIVFLNTELEMFHETSTSYASHDISSYVPSNAFRMIGQAAQYWTGAALGCVIAYNNSGDGARRYFAWNGGGGTIDSVFGTTLDIDILLNPAAPQTIYTKCYQPSYPPHIYVSGYYLYI